MGGKQWQTTPQELAQDAVCQSHTGHMTGLWFLPARPLRLNTNEWMNEWMNEWNWMMQEHNRAVPVLTVKRSCSFCNASGGFVQSKCTHLETARWTVHVQHQNEVQLFMQSVLCSPACLPLMKFSNSIRQFVTRRHKMTCPPAAQQMVRRYRIITWWWANSEACL